MIAATYKQGIVWRGKLSTARTIETILDPVIAIGLLFSIASAYDERLGPPYVVLALVAFSLTFPGQFHLHEHPRRTAR